MRTRNIYYLNLILLKSVARKKKKSRRHSGGIIVYYKKTISRGVTYVNYGSKSENRIWLKLDKSFFDFEHDLYVCSVYIPSVTFCFTRE